MHRLINQRFQGQKLQNQTAVVDSYYLNTSTVLSMVQSLYELSLVLGHDYLVVKSIKLLSRYAKLLNNEEYILMSKGLLLEHQLFTAEEMPDLEKLAKQCLSTSNQKPKCFNFLLGLARHFFTENKIDKCLKIVGTTLEHIGKNNYLVSAQLQHLLSLCRLTKGSFLVFPAPEILPNFCGGHKNVIEESPLELITGAFMVRYTSSVQVFVS